jgi:microcystin-dependent protein
MVLMPNMNKHKLGKEDILFDTNGTDEQVAVGTSTGSTRMVKKINANDLPLRAVVDLDSAETVEDAIVILKQLKADFEYLKNQNLNYADYLGSFADLSTLESAHPAESEGVYAVVLDELEFYIWDDSVPGFRQMNDAAVEAGNAAASASAASASAAAALASETAAASSELNAATSESNASTSETNAANSASAASTSATAASTSASTAETHKDDAETAKTAAEVAQSAAETAESNISSAQAKLDSIEENADVTDTANVDAAGATMNTDSDVSGNSWVLDEDDFSSDSNTKVPTQQSVKSYVDNNSGGIPTGSILADTTGSVPTGFLECDGAAVSRTTYSNLYAALGVMYGNGDGSTTFNLPDMRGQFLRGFDNGAGIDPDAASRTDRGDGTSGDNIGTLQADEFGAHGHTDTFKRRSSSDGHLGSSSDWLAGKPVSSVTTTSKTTSDSGGNETRPVNINVMFCIKY